MIPRPAVKRVNRTIKIPKTCKVMSRPSQVALQKIKDANTPNQIAPHAVRAKRIITNPKSRTVQRGQLKPRIIYDNKIAPQTEVHKIIKLRGVGSGKSLLIVGNGPSVAELDLTPLKPHPNIDILSINKPVPNLWPTTYWMFCDVSQYKRHVEYWDNYDGIIFNSVAIKNQKKNSIKIKNNGGMGFSRDLSKGMFVGRSTVYAAMQVALWMDYDNIYIVGCDMAAVKKDGVLTTHFYGNNPDVQPENRITRFDSEAKHYSNAASILPEPIRKRFTFCSSYNKYEFVNRFESIPHETCVEHILSKLGN